MFKLPVWLRRELGMKVNGHKPGSKRTKMVKAGKCHVSLESTLSDVNNLVVGSGVLIPAQYWQAEHDSFNAAQCGIRTKYPKRAFSIRVARAKGGTPDMLIIRTA